MLQRCNKDFTRKFTHTLSLRPRVQLAHHLCIWFFRPMVTGQRAHCAKKTIYMFAWMHNCFVGVFIALRICSRRRCWTSTMRILFMWITTVSVNALSIPYFYTYAGIYDLNIKCCDLNMRVLLSRVCGPRIELVLLCQIISHARHEIIRSLPRVYLFNILCLPIEYFMILSHLPLHLQKFCINVRWWQKEAERILNRQVFKMNKI